MNAEFSNVYDDPLRAEAYSTLEFPGTYYLAFRDLPPILRTCVQGTRALDFGCGAGRSTRFLRGLGFETVGWTSRLTWSSGPANRIRRETTG